MSTSGGKANDSGERLQSFVRELLKMKDFQRRYNVSCLEHFIEEANMMCLYDNTNAMFAEKIKVPLTAPCHHGAGINIEVDFLIKPTSGEYIVLSMKRQQVSGSAQEKLEFEMNRLIATGHPAGIMIEGDGWDRSVLSEIYCRVMSHGNPFLLTWRATEKLHKWISDGCPTPGKGVTAAQLIWQYSDRLIT